MEANNEPPTAYPDGSQLVMVPGHPNVSGKILFCPRFGGLFVCVLGCKCTIKKGREGCRQHLRQKHWEECGLPSPNSRLSGSSALEQVCNSLVQDSEQSDEGTGEVVLHQPVPFLAVHDGFKCKFFDACHFVTTEPLRLVKHHREIHQAACVPNDTDPLDLGSSCRVQILKKGTRKGIIVDDDGTEDTDENENGDDNNNSNGNNNGNGNNNNGPPASFEDEFPLPVEEVVETDFRRSAILEVISNWREIIPDENVKLVHCILFSNELFLPLVKKISKMANVFVHKSRKIIDNNMFPRTFLGVAAVGSKVRDQFTTVRTQPSAYVSVIGKLIRWFLVAAKVVVGNEENPVAIPEQWVVPDGDFKNSITELHSKLDVANLQGDAAAEAFTAFCAFANLLFARRARFSMNGHFLQQHDPVDFFVVASSLNHDATRQAGTSITSSIAGLEYVLRCVVLLKACDVSCTVQQEPGKTETDVWQAGKEYIETWCSPRPEDNTILNVLERHKALVKRFATKEVQVKCQFQDEAMMVVKVLGTQSGLSIPLLTTGVQEALNQLDDLFMFVFDTFVPPPIDISNLKDNLLSVSNGYSFVTDPQNNLEDLWSQFTDHVGAGIYMDRNWRWHFREATEAILDIILFLVHVTGGGPSRGTSMTNCFVRNTTKVPRAVCLYDSQVLFVVRYDKRDHIQQRSTVAFKFLGNRLSEHFLNYMVFLRPVYERIRAKDSARVFNRHLLQPDYAATDSKYNRMIEEHLLKFCHTECTFSNYRHCFEAFAKQHLTTQSFATTKDIADMQMGHSSRTGDQYGTTGQDIFGGTIFAQCKTASLEWQRILGLATATPQHATPQHVIPPAGQGGGVSEATNYVTPRLERNTFNHYSFNLHQPTTFGTVSHDRDSPNRLMSLLKSVKDKQVYEKPFSNEDTKTCFHQVFSCANTFKNSFVVVLPTGAGKSVFVHYPAMADKGLFKLVVVIIPFIPLLDDQKERAASLGIPFHQYDPSITGEANMHRITSTNARILFIQLEHLRHPCLALIQSLSDASRIGLVVFDEVHILFGHRKFRKPAVEKVAPVLRIVTVQKLFLTATLPPSEIPFLVSALSHPVGATLIYPEILHFGRIPPGIGMAQEWYWDTGDIHAALIL